jgi:hypothetical protein
VTDGTLRAACDSLRRQQAASALTADPDQATGKPARSLLRAIARRARLALTDPAVGVQVDVQSWVHVNVQRSRRVVW